MKFIKVIVGSRLDSKGLVDTDEQDQKQEPCFTAVDHGDTSA
jgi:hypothetical protein